MLQKLAGAERALEWWEGFVLGLKGPFNRAGSILACWEDLIAGIRVLEGRLDENVARGVWRRC